MNSNTIKVPTQDESGFAEGISGEALEPEQVQALRDLLDLMATVSEQNQSDPGIKLAEKCIGIRWGTEAMRAIRNQDDAGDDEEAGAELPDQDADPADLTVTDAGAFHGMSLQQSLDHLVRKGKASRAEVTKMSLEPDRNKAIFIQSRAPVPNGTYQDGRELEEREAEARVDRMFGKKA